MSAVDVGRDLVLDLARGVARPSGLSKSAPVIQSLQGAGVVPDWWYAPTAAQPGYDAVSDSEIFTREGTPTYGFGPGGQEIVTTPSGTHYAEANSGAFDAMLNPWSQLDNTSAWWMMFAYNLLGNTYLYNGLIGCGANNSSTPGFRAYINGNTGGLVAQIGNGSGGSDTSSVSLFDYDPNLMNVVVMQYDLAEGYYESYMNGRGNRSGGEYKALSATWTSTPVPHGHTLRLGSAVGLNFQGQFMAAGGRGILNARQVAALSEYGRGIKYADLSDKGYSDTDYFRAMVEDDPTGQSFRVAGKWDNDPTLKLYVQGVDKFDRGALVADSGTKTRDDNGRAHHTFTGLSNDTEYHLVVEQGGKEMLWEGRYKTLPSTFDGVGFALAGCWDWQTDTRDAYGPNHVAWNALINTGKRLLIGTDDDIYFDSVYKRLFGPGAGLPDTIAKLEAVADNQEVNASMQHAFRRMLFLHGAAGDHTLGNNDQWGNQIPADAVTFTKNRYGNQSYATAGNTYRSLQIPGVTFVILDLRTESISGVQLTSAAQRTWLSAELTAAVGRGDYIVLMTEKPWVYGGTSASQHWDFSSTLQAERTAIFDIIKSSGAAAAGRSQIVFFSGDHHSRGIDNGSNQGNFDTGSALLIWLVNACRLSHGFGQPSNPFSEYWQNSNQGFIEVDVSNVAGDLQLSLQPHVANTPAPSPAPYLLTLET